MNQAERKINTMKVENAIQMACKGNKDAESYLWAIARVARALDDHTDGDHDADIPRLVVDAMVNIPGNAFYLANQTRLVPVQALALNAWMDSNQWETAGGERSRQALVLRDYINELVQLVALIVGGWDHMRDVSMQVRELFFKEE